MSHSRRVKQSKSEVNTVYCKLTLISSYTRTSTSLYFIELECVGPMSTCMPYVHLYALCPVVGPCPLVGHMSSCMPYVQL